jgi:hypothetical protein
MAASKRSPKNLLYLGIFAVIPVVVAILVLIYSQVNAGDPASSCQQEYQTVQAALDAYMANNNLATVPASFSTHDMTSPVPLYTANGPAWASSSSSRGTSPSFMLTPQTQWSYGWDSMGRVTSISKVANGPPVPVGCLVRG